jgi:hypothetical protein
MNINLIIETIIILFTILISNGIIYSLAFFKLNTFSEKIFIITNKNNSEKDTLAFTSLIASNPINITSSESSASDNLSITSSESSVSDNLSVTSTDTLVSDNLSVTSSDTLVSEDIFDTDTDIFEDRLMVHTENSILSSPYEGPIPSHLDLFENSRSLDSVTILNGQTLEA